MYKKLLSYFKFFIIINFFNTTYLNFSHLQPPIHLSEFQFSFTEVHLFMECTEHAVQQTNKLEIINYFNF